MIIKKDSKLNCLGSFLLSDNYLLLLFLALFLHFPHKMPPYYIDK